MCDWHDKVGVKKAKVHFPYTLFTFLEALSNGPAPALVCSVRCSSEQVSRWCSHTILLSLKIFWILDTTAISRILFPENLIFYFHMISFSEESSFFLISGKVHISSFPQSVKKRPIMPRHRRWQIQFLKLNSEHIIASLLLFLSSGISIVSDFDFPFLKQNRIR